MFHFLQQNETEATTLLDNITEVLTYTYFRLAIQLQCFQKGKDVTFYQFWAIGKILLNMYFCTQWQYCKPYLSPFKEQNVTNNDSHLQTLHLAAIQSLIIIGWFLSCVS